LEIISLYIKLNQELYTPAVESPLLITFIKPYIPVMNKGCRAHIHDSYSNIFKSSILSKCFRFKVARGILWAIEDEAIRISLNSINVFFLFSKIVNKN
jgi:hypothetical protein